MPRGVAKLGKRKPKPIINTLEDNLALTDDNHLLWLGALSDGYGYFVRRVELGTQGGQRRMYRAHVETYKWVVGPIPEGMFLDHTCYVRNCCAPWHLEPVTQAENVRRGYVSRGYKDVCQRGHSRDVYETTRGDGRKSCRQCVNNAARRYRERKRKGD
jgi:hypothetical protein